MTQLKNKDGQSVSPKTTADAVAYSANQSVAQKIAELEQGGGTPSSGKIAAGGCWVSLGTSITWLNNNKVNNSDPLKAMTKGYQDWVQDTIQFTSFVNRGSSGAIATGGIPQIQELDSNITPDFVTIEFGVNDFALGGVNWLGTMDDFINTSLANNASFYRAYRAIIDGIYAKNTNAKIILITPRKADGSFGGGNWGQHWYEPKGTSPSLRYQKDYADAIIEIGKYMSLPVCDWFNECGANDITLARYSYDSHLHPNTDGMKRMAIVLIEAFKKVIPTS